MHRWPTGAEKAELFDGSLVFTGPFDERDVVMARRAYPGRLVELGPDGELWVHPANGPTPRLRESLEEGWRLVGSLSADDQPT